MDELSIIRDLGRELDTDPLATLVRQRQRLLDEANRRWRHAPRWALAGLVAAATAALILVPTVLFTGPGKVEAPAGERPAKSGKGLNVLMIGSDRATGDKEGRADTIVLLHLSADRQRGTAVSLPRDSRVHLSGCAGGPARWTRLGAALSAGGPTCVWRTVESLTRLRVDHVVQLDYAGVKNMVNALGGVEITLPVAVHDRNSKLSLPAGRHVVKGDLALAYLRLRHGIGDGSDLDRVKRQQKFMAAVYAKARASITDPRKLAAFLGVAGESFTTDSGLSLKDVSELAGSVRKADTHLRFALVPVRPSAADPNQLDWERPAADRVFEALRSDG